MTPWDALKYIMSEAFYGGRVTDDLDRRVITAYLQQFFNPNALTSPNFPLSSLPAYYIPDASTLDLFKVLPSLRI